MSQYQHPLWSRYTSQEMQSLLSEHPGVENTIEGSSESMQELFSARKKALDWRRLWVTLAEIQKDLGLPYSWEQIEALKKHQNNLDLERAREIERETRHDVMAFLQEYKEKVEPDCPGAGGILHAGATSCFVADNQEILTIKEALLLLASRLEENNEMELAKMLSEHANSFPLRGPKGTTGTQASYLDLFEGDEQKVLELEKRFRERMGFEDSLLICSQTYPRILDFHTLSLLHLVSDTLNLHCKAELHKRRASAAEMAANQWLERSLDDSAQRRIILSESFLLLDRDLQSSEVKAQSDPFKPWNPIELDAFNKIFSSLCTLLERQGELILKYKDLPCLAFTHYQVAQPTSYGKRLALWSYPFLWAARYLKSVLDLESVSKMQQDLALDMILVSASKMAADLRLLQHDLELNEPFGRNQIGSSAMAYKKNPMRSERVSALTRTKLHCYSMSDSAKRSILSVEAVLLLCHSILRGDSEDQVGFSVHEEVVKRRVQELMPFLVTERILMEGVRQGLDRQELHEVIRKLMVKSREKMDKGGGNPFLKLLSQENLQLDIRAIEEQLQPERYIGLSSIQAQLYQEEHLTPFLEQNKASLGNKGIEEVRV